MPAKFEARALSRNHAAPLQDERRELAAQYVAAIGYDPFQDDPFRPIDDVRRTLEEWRAAQIGA